MKPRVLSAISIYVLVISRLYMRHTNSTKLANRMLAEFDDSHDQRLTSVELMKLLGANGVQFNSEQVKRMFAQVDDEHDGFDTGELQEVVSILADIPNCSAELRDLAADSNRSIIIDLTLCVVLGAGLLHLVSQTQTLQQQATASRFMTAVRLRKAQHNCETLECQMLDLQKEKSEIEQQITDLHRSQLERRLSKEQKEQEIARLAQHLKEVEVSQHAAQDQLQKETEKWRQEAEKSTTQRRLKERQFDAVVASISGGIDAFRGAGRGAYKKVGAERGFSTVRSMGFARNLVTFGCMESGKLVIYEADKDKKLGEGVDCAYKCQNLSTGSYHALKIYGIKNPNQRRQILNDLYAKQELMGSHPHIVGYEQVIESEEQIFVLMELLPGQDLFDLVASKGLTERQGRHLFKQMVEGLIYLHKRKIIHCDIKPENAMVIGNAENETATLKLIDFGFSCFYTHTEEGGTDVLVPRDLYQAPEHMESMFLQPCEATDMWRLGCTLYVMIVQSIPFNDDAATLNGIKTRRAGEFHKVAKYNALSSEAQDLISQLLRGKPEERPSAEEVLKHPWVQKEEA